MSSRTRSPYPSKAVVFKPTGARGAERTRAKAVVADAVSGFLKKNQIPLRLVAASDLAGAIKLVFVVSVAKEYSDEERKRLAAIQGFKEPYCYLAEELGLADCEFELTVDADPSKPAGIRSLTLSIQEFAAGAIAARLNMSTCRNYVTPLATSAILCSILLIFLYFGTYSVLSTG
jgi:hypothetical protein